MEAIGLFFLYALVAIFLENAVFTRMLGVGRMVFLGTPKRILAHGAALTVITFFGSMLSFAANYLLYDYNVAVSLRALIYLCCLTVVYLILYLLCDRLPGKIFTPMKKLLPLSTFNCASLGALVLTTAQQHSFFSTVGFGLGTGVGYTLALLLIYTGRRRLELVTLPRAFKGMPIHLLYIGLVSLAIYGLIGHQLPT
ncbi:Rnf-Nqr domain containing protein [Harryflintia acetispora]|uniref:Electron transport complex protein RnfA n=1 Tax=Harryflintia acetispora TaxID=1849041 RepID=A0A9X8UIL0_9FIRM|nr:Rnf-Nqr domain containing protein [Harryflintia acetispora]TCL42807.1 electron transport complex protein RnfA [Harryflintia acetispora]